MTVEITNYMNFCSELIMVELNWKPSLIDYFVNNNHKKQKGKYTYKLIENEWVITEKTGQSDFVPPKEFFNDLKPNEFLNKKIKTVLWKN